MAWTSLSSRLSSGPIHLAGGVNKGREEVLKEVRTVHQTFLKNVTMCIERLDMDFVSPLVAVVEVIHVISPYEYPAGVRHSDERQVKIYAANRS